MHRREERKLTDTQKQRKLLANFTIELLKPTQDDGENFGFARRHGKIGEFKKYRQQRKK